MHATNELRKCTLDSSDDSAILAKVDKLLGCKYGLNSISRLTTTNSKNQIDKERRKVLDISLRKINKMNDANSSLRRSVLIKNTRAKLEAEIWDERVARWTHPPSVGVSKPV